MVTAASLYPASGPPSIGGEVAPALLRRLMMTDGLVIADWAVESAEQGDIPAAPVILVALRGGAREIDAALARGCRAYVELGDDTALPPGLLELLARSPAALHLSLSTATSFSLDMAPLLCGALVRRGWLSPQRRGDMEICVHEAVSNAIVHGNLDIHLGPSVDAGAFDGFYRAVQSRLADRAYACRRISVEAVLDEEELCITVRDQGRGHAGRAAAAGAEAKSGRGIRIMRELADRVDFTDGGRCAHLYFRR